jgi:hypothetical protein
MSIFNDLESCASADAANAMIDGLLSRLDEHPLREDFKSALRRTYEIDTDTIARCINSIEDNCSFRDVQFERKWS